MRLEFTRAALGGRMLTAAIYLTFFAVLQGIGAGPAGAMYVGDIMKITFRTGPGIAHKVIDEIETGQRVTVLSTTEGWTQARLPDGREGWVLTRFLTQRKPKALELEEARERLSSIEEKMAVLTAENTALKDEKATLAQTAETAGAELTALREAHEALRDNCRNFIDQKDTIARSEQTRKEQARRIDVMDAELSTLRRERNIRWFLTGAGVLFFGFILGMITRRQRRSSYL